MRSGVSFTAKAAATVRPLAAGLAFNRTAIENTLRRWAETGANDQQQDRRIACDHMLASLDNRRQKVLQLDGLQLASLPDCLGSLFWLESLSLSGNRLSRLPKLPAGPKHLWANQNALTHLRALPVFLETLSACDNQLVDLPTLPGRLKVIALGGNRLTSLPALPYSVHSLGVEENCLTSLPDLPPLLRALWAGKNQLVALPTLPATLATLAANDNRLETLPALPASLTQLWVHRNRLRQLPALPRGLYQLWVNENRIEVLPEIHGAMQELNVANNQLSDLPQLIEAMLAGATFDVSFNRWHHAAIQRILSMMATVGVIFTDCPVVKKPEPIAPAPPEVPYPGPPLEMARNPGADCWAAEVSRLRAQGLGRIEMQQWVDDYRNIWRHGCAESAAAFNLRFAKLSDGDCLDVRIRKNYLQLLRAFSQDLTA